MQHNLPVQLIKPRVLQEIPRSVYSNGPKLEGKDEKSRHSFISMLRKGPSKSEKMARLGPKNIELNCAAWLHSNSELEQSVSLILSYKDRSGEHLVLVDESNPGGSHSVMLSGCVSIQADGPIEYIKACCSGVCNTQHIEIEDLHVKRNTQKDQALKMVANS